MTEAPESKCGNKFRNLVSRIQVEPLILWLGRGSWRTVMVRKRSLVWGTAVFILLSVIAVSLGAGQNQQRQDFLDAEKALREKRMQDYKTLTDSLRDYPLYPYLIYARLVKDISLDSEKEILEFLDQYSSSPLSGQLRARWLAYLADKGHWTRLVRDYRHLGQEKVRCSYGSALLHTGHTGQAWNEAESLWLHGRSRPKECDPLFDGWRQAGKLTPELTRERISLTMDQGQYNLAGYLGRYLPEEDRPWLDLWLKIARNQLRITDVDWSAKDQALREKILPYAMGRLIRRDALEAAGKWDQLCSRYGWSKTDFPEVQREIALYLALRRYSQALERMNSLPETVRTPVLNEWHMRAALFRQDWQEVLQAWEKLTQDQKESWRWQYWRARALEETGRNTEASVIYIKLLGRQNYFSLLAADRINQPYVLHQERLNPAQTDVQMLLQDPGIQRALELYHLDRLSDARREWQAAMQGRNSGHWEAAAFLAHELGWNERAIQSAAIAGRFHDLALRFPLSFNDLIFEHALEKGLDPAWILALARQESMFMPDVSSPAGARGVMQIMPATGRIIASRLGESLDCSSLLFDPRTNIRYGTFYLHMRLEELQHNPVLATAAYNAGVNRVLSWLPEEGGLPADIWVENIPFRETRDYVERVFAYTAIYQLRLNQTQSRVLDRMHMVYPKSYTPVQLAGTEES